MIYVISCAIKCTGVSESEGLLKRNRNPHQVSALGNSPCPGQGMWKQFLGNEMWIQIFLFYVNRIVSCCFLYNKIIPVHFVMPRTSMKEIGALKIKYSRSLYIQRNIEGVGLLVEIMACISSPIITLPVIGTSHVSSDPNPLIGQSMPLNISIFSNRYYWWVRSLS